MPPRDQRIASQQLRHTVNAYLLLPVMLHPLVEPLRDRAITPAPYELKL